MRKSIFGGEAVHLPLVINVNVAEHECFPPKLLRMAEEDSRCAQVTPGHRQEGFVWAWPGESAVRATFLVSVCLA